MTPTTNTNPGGVTVTTSTGTSTNPGTNPPSELQTILHDIFLLGVGAAAIFIKNPASAQKAGNIVQILQTVFPFL